MGVQRIQVGKGLEGTEGGAALPFAPQFDLEGQGGAAGGAAAGDAGAHLLPKHQIPKQALVSIPYPMPMEPRQ